MITGEKNKGAIGECVTAAYHGYLIHLVVVHVGEGFTREV